MEGSLLDILPAECLVIIIEYLYLSDHMHFTMTNKYYNTFFFPKRIQIKNVQDVTIGHRHEYITYLSDIFKYIIGNHDIDKKIIYISNQKLKNLFRFICTKLKYMTNDTYHHLFIAKTKFTSSNIFSMKMAPYSVTMNTNMVRTDRIISNKLASLVLDKITPHILLPIMSFKTDITIFINMPSTTIPANLNRCYDNFRDNYNDYKKYVSVTIYEPHDTNLRYYLDENYSVMTLLHWKVIIFQILFTLDMIQKKYPSFRHNELKASAILIYRHDTIIKGNFYKYNVASKDFILPYVNFQCRIYNFDLASIVGIVKNDFLKQKWWTKKYGNCTIPNRYYDMHFFLNYLCQMHQKQIPEKILQFIHRIIPKPYRHIRGPAVNRLRLLVHDKYTTPEYVLLNDPLFDEFRK